MKSLTSPVERARAYVSVVPGAVSGAHGHNQTFAVACALVRRFNLAYEEALSVLREYNCRCAPSWSERELRHKLESALRAGKASGTNTRLAAWPPRLRPPSIDPVTAVEIFLKGFRCDEVDLWDASPVRPLDDWTKDAVTVLECLFRPGERVNFVTRFREETDAGGRSKAKPSGTGETVERDSLLKRWNAVGMPRSRAGGWLRMNPVDGRGVGDGHVTAFRFALVENDTVPLELQMPLLAKLPLPITAILTSGGRSLHAWVVVEAASLVEYGHTVARMLAILGRFGVDPSNRNPSRMSRLPGVVREIGSAGDGRQRLLYLNPRPKQEPIL